jgi:hypothetical protein
MLTPTHSGWLSKESRGSRSFKVGIWLVALLVLGAIGGGGAPWFSILWC